MRVDFSIPDVTEKEVQSMVEVLRSGWITTGPKTKLFEKKLATYCKNAKAACLNSATACLETSLRVLGVGAGDEVITSAYTYTASASVIEHVGAKIVLVDTAENSFFMDSSLLEQAITEKTKAIIPVDIGGIPCDYDEIMRIINKKSNLFQPANNIQKQLGRVAVILDSAHSLGSINKGRIVGSYGDFTCFSFHAVKNLTTAEGGAILFNSIGNISADDIYKEVMLWSLHGQDKDALAKSKNGSWEYDIKKLGYKCNITDIAAVLGISQLERYNDLLRTRRKIVMRYSKGLDEKILRPIYFCDDYQANGHIFMTRVEGADEHIRNKIVEKMSKHGIAVNVHFKPLPMFSAYKDIGFDIKNFPNSYNQYKNEITLPLHTKLTIEQVDYVIKTYNEIINQI